MEALRAIRLKKRRAKRASSLRNSDFVLLPFPVALSHLPAPPHPLYPPVVVRLPAHLERRLTEMFPRVRERERFVQDVL